MSDVGCCVSSGCDVGCCVLGALVGCSGGSKFIIIQNHAVLILPFEPIAKDGCVPECAVQKLDA